MEKEITLTDLYKELKRIEANMITRQQLASLVDTIDILSDEETMKEIRESEHNIKQGKVKEFKY